MPASTEVVRLLERDPDARGASPGSIRSLLGSMDSDEVVHRVGTGICGIRKDDGIPVLYVVTNSGIRAVDLLGPGKASQFIARSEIIGQDWTPLDASWALGECYGTGKRIIFRLWFHSRPDASALTQVNAFSIAIEKLGVASPR